MPSTVFILYLLVAAFTLDEPTTGPKTMCSQAANKDPVESLLSAMEEAHREPGDNLCCGHCLKPVTTTNEKNQLKSQHLFHVTNEDGLAFNIACFKEAWGCGMHGNPSAEHSWFSAYRWQFANGLNCDAHLGWHYELPNENGLQSDNKHIAIEHFFCANRGQTRTFGATKF